MFVSQVSPHSDLIGSKTPLDEGETLNAKALERMAFCATLAQIAEVIAAVPHNFSPETLIQLTSGISTDTRRLRPNETFLALKGETFDGHRFIDTACDRGALAAIVSSRQVLSKGLPYLQVGDTLHAYQQLAHWWRNHLAIPLVAITGSVGKTTTKELIAAALATQGSVLKTQANDNNEIGVPKTLLALAPTHTYAVVEMGMRGRGEIALLSQIARPDVAVITNVGTAHIGRLGSKQAIAAAKCELLAEMPADSVAVLNHDNGLLMQTAAGIWPGRRISFGLTGGDVCGTWVDEHTLRVNGVSLPLPLPGEHNALNYLAAIAVMQALDLDWTVLAQGITVDLPAGRAKRIELPNDIVVLDETYNAGAESMAAALKLLAALPGQRRIAVLGTMKELGDHSLALHRYIGTVVKSLGIDRLLVLADPAEAKALVEGAAAVSTQTFNHPNDLIEALENTVQAGDRILFKASHSVALDRVVHQLCQNKQD